jgi:hypothetical protein
VEVPNAYKQLKLRPKTHKYSTHHPGADTHPSAPSSFQVLELRDGDSA